MYKNDIKPFGALPSERQLNHFKKFGKKAFFHFGVNTFSNMEWGDGTEAEKLFNPTETDVRQWIKTIKAAGFTLAILTVKHHDGFCLWPSKYTEHSVKNSPYKNGNGDILREFVDACHEFDIAVGIYISPWDRNSEFWGMAEYSIFYNNQLTELMTEYGKIDEVWWDGAGSTETPYDWGLWAYTIRTHQPDAVIFGSLGATPYVECHWVGNEAGFAGDPHYPTIDSSCVENEITELMNSGVFNGNRFMPAEVDTSIRPGWFYHKEQDYFVKTTSQLVELWYKSVGSSAFMLLNFPPDRRGLVHEIDAKNAIEANNIISKALSVNFAANADVKATSLREGYSADGIINGNYNAIYAASEEDIHPVIEITLPEEKTFDTFVIGEYIELGVRVTGFKVEAFVDGEWKLLADKKSIGFKKAVYFDEITSGKIRISIYDAGAAPVLREFGLYSFNSAGYDPKVKKIAIGEKFNIAENPSANIIYEDDGVLVQIGGLFPYNTIKFNGEGIDKYELHIFNGARFRVEKIGENPGKDEVITLEKTEIGSYQFKLKTGKKENESINIRVYEM